MNYLARLRVLAHDVIMVDLVFGYQVACGGRSPMSIYRGPDVVLVHLFEISPC